MRWIAFVIAAVVIFTVFVSVYAASASRAEVRLLPKWLWVLLCIFLPPIGGLLYLVTGRPTGAGSGNRQGVRRGFKTVAPDDDPEFLRNLADKLKQDDTPKPEAAPEPTTEGSAEKSAPDEEGDGMTSDPDKKD